MNYTNDVTVENTLIGLRKLKKNKYIKIHEFVPAWQLLAETLFTALG